MRTTLSALGVVILMLATSAVLQGQENQASSASTSPEAAMSASGAQSNPPHPALQRRNPRYQIQRDDVLTLSFPLSPELNQTVTVQPDGYITLLNAGDLDIHGMTVPELVRALQKSYANVLHDPIINVDLKDFQKPFFVVGGQVTKPGQFDLRYDTTVSEAIAIAGGLTQAAKSQVFLFHRVSSGWVEVKKLRMNDIFRGKNINEDAILQPGDMIFVPENAISNFRKYVPYNVGMYVNPLGAIL